MMFCNFDLLASWEYLVFLFSLNAFNMTVFSDVLSEQC